MYLYLEALIFFHGGFCLWDLWGSNLGRPERLHSKGYGFRAGNARALDPHYYMSQASKATRQRARYTRKSCNRPGRTCIAYLAPIARIWLLLCSLREKRKRPIVVR